MRKIGKLVAAAVLLTAIASPATAFNPAQQMYSYTYYSDASYTTVVGSGADMCFESAGQVWVITPLWMTDYVVATPSGECRVGGPL